jgi:hypothetical protein
MPKAAAPAKKAAPTPKPAPAQPPSYAEYYLAGVVIAADLLVEHIGAGRNPDKAEFRAILAEIAAQALKHPKPPEN